MFVGLVGEVVLLEDSGAARRMPFTVSLRSGRIRISDDFAGCMRRNTRTRVCCSSISWTISRFARASPLPSPLPPPRRPPALNLRLESSLVLPWRARECGDGHGSLRLREPEPASWLFVEAPVINAGTSNAECVLTGSPPEMSVIRTFSWNLLSFGSGHSSRPPERTNLSTYTRAVLIIATPPRPRVQTNGKQKSTQG